MIKRSSHKPVTVSAVPVDQVSEAEPPLKQKNNSGKKYRHSTHNKEDPDNSGKISNPNVVYHKSLQNRTIDEITGFMDEIEEFKY